MPKKEFKWDEETLVLDAAVNEYQRKQVRMTKLNDKEFVAFTTLKKIKDYWQITGGFTLPKVVFLDTVKAVAEFMSTETEGKKTTAKKTNGKKAGKANGKKAKK